MQFFFISTDIKPENTTKNINCSCCNFRLSVHRTVFHRLLTFSFNPEKLALFLDIVINDPFFVRALTWIFGWCGKLCLQTVFFKVFLQPWYPSQNDARVRGPKDHRSLNLTSSNFFRLSDSAHNITALETFSRTLQKCNFSGFTMKAIQYWCSSQIANTYNLECAVVDLSFSFWISLFHSFWWYTLSLLLSVV